MTNESTFGTKLPYTLSTRVNAGVPWQADQFSIVVPTAIGGPQIALQSGSRAVDVRAYRNYNNVQKAITDMVVTLTTTLWVPPAFATTPSSLRMDYHRYDLHFVNDGWLYTLEAWIGPARNRSPVALTRYL